MKGMSSTSTDEYRRFARIYDMVLGPALLKIRYAGVRMFPPDPGMKVLDVGCGTGAHLDIYRKFGCRLYGLDTSPSMLAVAGKRLGGKANLRFHDAGMMPFESNSFDMVLCMFVLHEMSPSVRKATLREMKRVVKPGGRILLIDFNAGRPRTLRGWYAKLMIFMAEVAAGKRHFRNYRQFMSTNGLTSLVFSSFLVREKQEVLAGGALIMCLLRSGN